MIHHLLGDFATGDRNQSAHWLVGQTVFDVVRHLGGSLGQIPGVVEGGVADQRRVASGRGDACLGAIAGRDAADVELVELLLQVVEVDQGGDATVIVNLDQAVLVLFLGPLVNQTAGECLGHFLAIQSLHLGKDTRLHLVAAILGEEDRQSSVGEVLGQNIEPAGLVRGITAPGVGVQPEEVGARAGGVLHLAFKVVGCVHQDIADICCRVADGNGTIALLGDVILHVTDDGPHVSRGQASGVLVDDFVSSKEAQSVVEGLEGLDHTKDLVVVVIGVGGPGSGAVQVAIGEGRVHIEDHIDTRRIEDGGALVVVKSGLQVIHTDGVDLCFEK